MSTWYKVKISYFRTSDDGAAKRVSEEYLIDAVSFTEAEARLYEEISELVPEFIVSSVVKTKFTDIYDSSDAADSWYKCKVSYTSYDELSGKEKTVSTLALTKGNDLLEAHNTTKERLKTLQIPFVVDSIVKTKIVDVLYFKSSEDAG